MYIHVNPGGYQYVTFLMDFIWSFFTQLYTANLCRESAVEMQWNDCTPHAVESLHLIAGNNCKCCSNLNAISTTFQLQFLLLFAAIFTFIFTAIFVHFPMPFLIPFQCKNKCFPLHFKKDENFSKAETEFQKTKGIFLSFEGQYLKNTLNMSERKRWEKTEGCTNEILRCGDYSAIYYWNYFK